MKKILFITNLLLCLMVFQSCGEKMGKAQTETVFEETVGKKYQDIIGKWTLTAIKFYPRDEIIIPTKDYWISLDEGRFSFKKEANACHTKYEINGRKQIKIQDQIACTKMCCDGDISDKLTYENVTEYKLDGEKLVLIAKDRKFEFARAKEN